MKEKKTGDILLFPAFEKLKEEGERLRVSLSMLLLERDELRFVICPNLETEYMMALGHIEYKVYEAWVALERLRRKIDLIQAKKNREEKVSLLFIERQLDEEFQAYQKELEEKLKEMNEALRRSELDTLSREEADELKSLYRKIVKRLHPDMNPHVTEGELELLHHAMEAYRNGGLEELRIIWTLAEKEILPEPEEDAMKTLLVAKKRLEDAVHKVSEEIQQIKESYPYTMKNLLMHKDKVEEKKEEFLALLEDYRTYIRRLEMKIEDMMR